MLAGDPKKLPGIGAGGILRGFAERPGVAELTSVHWFHSELAPANSKVSPTAATAPSTCLTHGRIHHGADWDSIVEEARTHQAAALDADHSFQAIAATNGEAHPLNLALHSQLDLSPELLGLQRTDLDPAWSSRSPPATSPTLAATLLAEVRSA